MCCQTQNLHKEYLHPYTLTPDSQLSTDNFTHGRLPSKHVLEVRSWGVHFQQFLVHYEVSIRLNFTPLCQSENELIS